MARHLAPFSCRQRMAEIVRRRSFGGVLPLGRQASISGSSLIQCASVNIALSSFQDGQNAIPVRRFKVEQALGGNGEYAYRNFVFDRAERFEFSEYEKKEIKSMLQTLKHACI